MILNTLWLESDNNQLLLVSAVSLLTLLWILTFFLNKKPSNKMPPGPTGLPLLGNLLSIDPDLHTYFASLARTHGPIFALKLGRKTGLVITSPAIAKLVLKDQDTTFANRDVPVAAKEATYGGADIVWNSYGPEWRLLRKVAAREMLGGKTLDSVYSLRRREIRETVRYLRGLAGSPVDVGEQMFLTALNVITGMMWGGTVKAEERARLGGVFKEMVSEMVELLGKPNLSDFYPGLGMFDVQGIRKKMRGVAKRLDEVIERAIDERVRMNDSGEESNKDFLQVLLGMKDDDEGDDDATTPFNMTHLKAVLMIGYGSRQADTASNTVEFALAELMTKPEILTKLQQELEEVVGKDNMVEESDTNKLPYLQSVMKEVLRLHPALPLLVPHCLSTTCTVAGYTVPKGARVFVNVWAIHRDPSIWENPLEFRPERFLDGKWDYSGNDFNYFPFGSGRRICAGINMAERMFMFSLASLVHSFDWSLPDGEKMDMSEKFGIVLKKKTPLIAIPTPRLSNPALYE